MDEYSIQLDFPYSIGVNLAVNAVSDLYILWDAPACAVNKAKFIHGNHDLFSTLLSASTFHRMSFSAVTANTVAVARENDMEKRILRLAAMKDCAAVLTAAYPMALITGIQYDMVARRAREQTKKPVIEVPSLSMSEDWLRGYEETLAALAGVIELPPAKPAADTVAIVGHLMDRNEEDNTGNLRELKRMLAGIGLKLVCVWLSGGRYRDLAKVAGAETIISMPYGRAAAAALARRAGARLVETELPLGFDATRRWLETIAAATGREERARRFIDSELSSLAPRLEWIVPRLFLGKRIALMGEPVQLPHLAQILDELGAEVCFAAAMGRPGKCPERLNLAGGRSVPVHAGPGITGLRKSLDEVFGGDPPDLLVTNTLFRRFPELSDMRFFEFGFPSFFTHFLYDSPFLGFNGAVNLIGRMAERMAFYEG